jgi:tetratricopeptide (TPR) repeat protein
MNPSNLGPGGPPRSAAQAQAEDLNAAGLARFAQGDLPGALAAFAEATRACPDYPEARNNHGLARQLLGGLAEAVEDFSRALAARPDYAEAWNNRGRARQALGDHAGALADFDRSLACASGPFRAAVYHNRGGLRQAAGDLAGALADFDRALEIDPGQAATLVNRGAARKERGDLAGALADFDRALEATPVERAAPAYHGRGGVRVLLNDFQGAIADYDEALRLDPGHALVYLSRGHARYHRRDPRGLADYLMAFSLAPEESARELARVLAEGAHRGAEEVLANCEKHMRICAGDLLARARRGLTLVLLGREEEAAADLTAVRSALPGGARHFEEVLQRVRGHGTGLSRPAPAVPPGTNAVGLADLVFAAALDFVPGA